MKRRDLNDSDPYSVAWIRYEQLRTRSTIIPVALFFGGAGATALLVAAAGERAPQWLGAVAMLPWIVAAILQGQGAVRAPCPRCGKPFNSTAWGHNGFARRCLAELKRK